MKKHSNKSSKQPKTKIELKIKSKTVTNNFILTPRTVSPSDNREMRPKNEREEIKSERNRYEDITGHRPAKDNKSNEYRRAITDNVKINGKKRFEEDETGTHTPLIKRISVTQQGFNKKKSTNSLLSSEKTRQRNKHSDKLSKNLSGELSTATVQRVIGIIIKDYKEGKLKERQLEETLIELFDRREKKNLVKKKKKDIGHEPFSNEFLKSVTQHTRSQALARKRRPSADDEPIEERVLERQGFVNKIIIKGITTSMFLKDEDSDSYVKETNARTTARSPSFNIHTSNSVREINEQMRIIQQQYRKKIEKSTVFTYEDHMASKIQRAWRRYRTRKLLRNNAFCRINHNVFNILDEQFTDQEVNDYANSPIDELKGGQKFIQKHTPSLDYSELTQIILKNLKEKKTTKQECLKNILAYLNVQENQMKIDFQGEEIQVEGEISHKPIQIEEVKSQDHSSEQDIIESRVRPLEIPLILEKGVVDQLSETPSNELEMNSFTNKYSSKQNVQACEFYKGQSFKQDNEVLDNSSLTFVHSQTVANQSFKTINIQNIEDALQTREQGITNRKEREIQNLTEKLLGSKITKEEYSREKEQIEKWFKSQLKELKKVKNSLIMSCNQACKVLQSATGQLESEKSCKMMKCLSQRYIKSKDWVVERVKVNKQKEINQPQTLKCEPQQEDLRTSSLGFKEDEESLELMESAEENLIFNMKERVDGESSKKLQMSPKMTRLDDESDDITDYKYEQIQRVIDEDQQSIEDGLLSFDNIKHKNSDSYDIHYNQQQIQAQQISLINNFVNESTKFKYLCQQNKQDIFEFLFLDLVLQMFTETMTGQNKILRAAQIYINKAKRLKKIPKGIRTSIASSKEYLAVLSKFIVKQQNGLRNLSHPMGPSAIEMLKYMRDEIVDTDQEEAISSTLVLNIDVFEKVSRLPELELKLQRYYDDEDKEHNRLSFLKTALNINNKSLFDCLNQNLDHERPYGVWGKPFPWKKVLSLDRKWSQQDQEGKLRKSIEKTIESCSYLCGILVDKEDSLFGSHRVSEQYVMQIREDRLSKMLANELIQNQERWIFYDDEQTEIMMEVSSYITKKLIKEVVLEIVSLKMKF